MELFALVEKPRLSLHASDGGLEFLGAPVNADTKKPGTDLEVVLILDVEWG